MLIELGFSAIIDSNRYKVLYSSSLLASALSLFEPAILVKGDSRDW
jgi:hypothetical protein